MTMKHGTRAFDRHAAKAAWSLWIVSLAFAASTVLFYLLSLPISLAERDRPPLGFLPVLVITFLVFSTVGAVVASRRPGNAVGWLFCLVGVYLGAGFSGQFYADYTLIVRPGALPGGEIAAWILSWTSPLLMAAPAFLLLLFPNGQPLSSRWRVILWIAAIATAMTMVGAAFNPGILENDYPMVAYPALLEGPLGMLMNRLYVAGSALLATVLLLAVVSLLLRYMRSCGEVRQQIKWILYVGGVAAAAFITGFAIPGSGPVADLVWATGFVAIAGIPIAAGVAILKYRLYDINIIIRRTLVYTVLTAVLLLVYFGSVTLMQHVFRLLTGQGSQLAIVLSTLAIAALFQPLRRRVQAFIDRRFYRRRYDAERTLRAFGKTVRDEVELVPLVRALVDAVEDTLHPALVLLWLKEEQP